MDKDIDVEQMGDKGHSEAIKGFTQEEMRQLHLQTIESDMFCNHL
jgi:hypothetical protein